MVKCKAKQDGQLPSGKYVYEDEIFEADKCPSWAEQLEKPVKKAEKPKYETKNAEA